MGKCFRHFKALMRKNFIVWYRNPGCASVEIIAPIILMAALWIIRNQVPVTSIDKDGMFSKKYPTYYAAVPEGGSKSKWGFQNQYNNAYLLELMKWSNYTAYDNPDPTKFDIGRDWFGAQFYGPGHCIRTTDYDHPKVSSPDIAIIGTQSFVTDQIAGYFKELVYIQRRTAAKYALPAYKIVNYNTIEEMEEYIKSSDYKTGIFHKGICFGIQHYVDELNPDNYTFSLHFPDKKIGFTKLGYNQGVPDQSLPVYSAYNSNPDMYSYFRYQHQGFSYLQTLITWAILQKGVDNINAWVSYVLQPMQTDATILDPLEGGISLLLPLFLLLAFIPPVYNTTFKIVREKESRAKETMRIMGMTDMPYWLSWFCFYTIFNTILSTIAWLLLLPGVINYSNIGYMWLFFWLYGEAIFGQIIFLQSMFTGSKYAGIVSTVIYFCGVLVNKSIDGEGTTLAMKVLASLLPQVALMQGSAVFANYEGTGVGINYSTADVIYQEYSFNIALYMMTFDFLLFFFLGFYLDKVVPSDFGQRLHPCFCFMPSYYRRSRRRNNNLQQVDESQQDQLLVSNENDTFESAQMPTENYEAPPLICKRLENAGDYLRIQNLQKTYGSGFQAVKGVNMKMYDSQIFTLLGHNGAGKSTIISMLTGLIQRSTGQASCYEVDMFSEMDELREFMGVCPQHDVLFDDLNAKEHLSIFYDFKGGDESRKQQEIESLIQSCGLSIDQNKIAKTLSGGNRRKLSVCLALCGNSKLVLLDEPTAGMDLGARRNLWDMLKSFKKDRIIILTTHYMDEADVLGDRIGIMVRGELKCIGSSLFLKNRFGLGYKITFVKKQKKVHQDLERFLNSYFSGAQKSSEVHEEISFVIPKDQAQNFAGFFETLDDRLDDYDIKSYGVSMSNLEDVFLKINQEFAPELFGDLKGFGDRRMQNLNKKGNLLKSQHLNLANSDTGLESTLENSGELSDNSNEYSRDDFDAEDDGKNLIRGSSCVRSCTASSGKRMIIYKRDWCGLLCQVVIPLVLVFFGLWLQSGPTKLQQSPPRPLSTGFWPYKQRMVMNDQPVSMANDGFDVTGSQLTAMLPNSTQAFEVKYIDGQTYNEFYDSVYAARNDGELYPYRYGSFQVFQANKASNIYNIIAFLNVTSQEATAHFPQFMNTAILRVALDKPDLGFNIINYPFPIYQKWIDIEQAAGAFDFVFMNAIALALIPCVMVQFILNEREKQLKHQQLLSGMSLIGYWASNLILDILLAYIPILLIMALTYAFRPGFQGIWVLLLLYPPAVVPFTYVTSFMFRSDINAQIMTLFTHFVAGALFTVVVFVLQQVPVTMQIGDALRWTCTIIPSFCVSYGILFSASGSLIADSRIESRQQKQEGPPVPRQIPSEVWAWYNLRADAWILVLHFFFSLFILFLIEVEFHRLFYWVPKIGCRSFSRQQRLGPELVKDDDVIAEEKRVSEQQADRATFMQNRGSISEGPIDNDHVSEVDHVDCIRVNNFSKDYEPWCGLPVKAVRQASFGLDYGECFALLGVNGAGKSTTFKSLTREIQPSTGQISIQGYNIQDDFAEARKLIGYCPQYDAIFPELTVVETLKFYALIKGLRTSKIESVVNKAIQQLNLGDHKNKQAGTLSGGNKRKLSVAMALIGNPPIILLDEPSAGMDPEARRFMWQVVEKISQREKRSAVILTTHSMEEAEALSTKLGIMVRGGVFRCMGSTQHIKNKFGIGYEVEIKLKKASYNDLEDQARQLGFNQDLQSKIPLEDALEQLRSQQFDKLILEQICLDGLGSDIQLEADVDPNQSVRLRNLMEFLRAQRLGFGIIKYLTGHFEQVELLEHCGEFFKLRVPVQGKTIGWLFGQIESDKQSLGVQEYSVTQTTLEQIFQSFANQSIASDKAVFTFVSDGDGLVLLNPKGQSIGQSKSLIQSKVASNASQGQQNDGSTQMIHSPKNDNSAEQLLDYPDESEEFKDDQNAPGDQ